MTEFLNSFMVPALKNTVTKKSIYNQYVSDLVTKIDNNIYQENTKVHIFYALGMGKKYRKRNLRSEEDHKHCAKIGSANKESRGQILLAGI